MKLIHVRLQMREINRRTRAPIPRLLKLP